MVALLPLVGGVLLGWFAQRRTAIALQVVICAIAIAILTGTAPDHGGAYRDILWIGPLLVVASAGTLLLGLWCGRVTARRRAQS